jgi:hypothetical protein
LHFKIEEETLSTISITNNLWPLLSQHCRRYLKEYYRQKRKKDTHEHESPAKNKSRRIYRQMRINKEPNVINSVSQQTSEMKKGEISTYF